MRSAPSGTGWVPTRVLLASGGWGKWPRRVFRLLLPGMLRKKRETLTPSHLSLSTPPTRQQQDRKRAPTAGPRRAAGIGQRLPAGEGATPSPGPRTWEETSDLGPPRRWSCRLVLPETLEARAALLGRGRSCDQPGKGRPL